MRWSGLVRWTAAAWVAAAVASPAIARAADAWVDGSYHYRVLLADGTITVECQRGACAVQPFAFEPPFGPAISVPQPVPLTEGGASLALTSLEGCTPGEPQGRALSFEVRPGADLSGTVSVEEVTSQNCIKYAQSDTFVAELVALPSGPPPPGPTASSDTSVLSSLRTLSDVTPAEVGAAAGGAVVLVALVAFPSSLLNSAVGAASQRLSVWRRRGREPDDASDSEVLDKRWWWAAGGVFVAGVISTFVDPTTGLNLHTARMLGSVLSSFTLEVVVGWVVVLLLMRRRVPTAAASYNFKPASLLVVAGLVIFSRLTQFEPGIIFGLIAGVTYVALESRRGRAMETIVPATFAFAVALVAWVGYSALGSQDDGVGLFLSETMAAAVAGGIAALPLVLLPVRGLSGHAVYEWNRKAWALGYLVALIAFFVVLMPIPGSWAEVDVSLLTWLAGYACYTLVGLAAWLILRERGSTLTPTDPSGRVASDLISE